jgi:hypothetical protein
LFILLFSATVFAQNQYNTVVVTDSIPINLDNDYNISSVSIIPFSEKIVLRDSLLTRFQDYQFNYSKATFTLSDTLPYSIFDTLFVTYQTIKLSLNKEYKRRSLVIKYDEERQDTVRISEIEGGAFTPDAIFGSGIQKSGTLIRGFTVGTTKDFSLQSGLRLQLSGNLSDDIEIVAALTDENTPIQPEGNTERLEELDRVFIQIKHPNAVGTFGDYLLVRRVGEFGVVNRKLQGLMGEFFLEDHAAYISIGSPRGKFNTSNFRGMDGVQGPYDLIGINGEKNIIVIAGTERVFVDGIEMVRGENGDYIIEYANATITFTPNRLITELSRISVDFEYTSRQYNRNFIGGGVTSNLLSNKLNLQFQYIREGDDEDSPIDLILSEEDKRIIAEAGDNQLKATKSGVSLAEPDSLGVRRGVYSAVDTLIDGEPFTYYLYNPGDSTAIYNVSFSDIGEGLGDYIREAIGNFKFVGISQGRYMPIVFLPLPEENQLGNLVLKFTPFENTELSAEYSGSFYDQNKLSNLDDGNNYGYATNINLNIKPSEINLGSLSLGKIGLSYKDRFIQGKFYSADRFNEVEFNRIYNINPLTQRQDESLREVRLSLLPVKEFSLVSLAGFLRRGSEFKSDRFNSTLKITNNDNYNFDYNFDYNLSENIAVKTDWLRQAGNGYFIFWKLKPGVEFLAEIKEDVSKQRNNDSLLTGSFRYLEVNPFIQLVNIDGLLVGAKYSLRDEYLPLLGVMRKQSQAITHHFDVTYSGIKEINTIFNLTVRNRNFTQPFKELGALDNKTILVRSNSKFKLWEPILNGNLFYEVTTKMSARLEKVFVPVESGTGNYRYLGDLNGNGVADEDEFEPTVFDGDFILVTIPSDELFPVIELRANTRWRIRFADILDRNTFVGTILKPLSTETVWRIEEITKEEDFSKIYSLRLEYFQVEGKTIRGSNFFQQDVFINENSPDLSFRFRYTQNIRMSDFNTGIERGYNRERSLRIRFRMIKEFSNQTDVVNFVNNNSSAQILSRNFAISDNSITSDFSYRPGRNLEVGFILKVGRSEDTYPETPTVIDLNSQRLRLNLNFTGIGRLRIEIERAELVASSDDAFIPFELTGGSVPGKNYFARVNFDYRIASFLQITLDYNGRLQGSDRAIHIARAEARAYF